MMSSKLYWFWGPRIPAGVVAANRLRYRLPTIFFSLAALMLIASMFVPYWHMTLMAPQYPGGLSVQVYVNRMTGDVQEIDGLNHYIGMRPLEEAAQLERSVSVVAISVIVLLIAAAFFVHTKWAVLFALPAATVPFVFLLDMGLWLRHFGQNLDPTAPLSSAVKPFSPPLLGTGKVGQFETIAGADQGLILAVAASLFILIGLYLHRSAYKPLVDGQEEED